MVSEILSRVDYSSKRGKSRAEDALTLGGFFFSHFPCVYPFYMNHFSRRRGAINNVCACCGEQTCSRSGLELTSLCLGRSLELPRRAARNSHHLHGASVKTSVRSRDPSLRCHPSLFLLLHCLFPSLPPACSRNLRRLIPPRRSGSLGQVLNHLFSVNLVSVRTDRDS